MAFLPRIRLASAVGGVGRHVHYLRRVANRPRRKEEFFKLALSAVEHRSNTESVRQNLCAHACHAVVDRKLVFHTVERVLENRIPKLRKRLNVLDFIVIDHGELAERPIAIGFGRIRPVGAGRKASLVGPVMIAFKSVFTIVSTLSILRIG